MNFEQADEVAYLLDVSFDIHADVRDDYSGRGMYGDSVAALVLDAEGDIAYVGYAFRSLCFDAPDKPRPTHSMGVGIVL